MFFKNCLPQKVDELIERIWSSQSGYINVVIYFLEKN